MAANASAIRRGPIFLDGTSTLLAETSFGNSTALPLAQWVEATHLPAPERTAFWSHTRRSDSLRTISGVQHMFDAAHLEIHARSDSYRRKYGRKPLHDRLSMLRLVCRRTARSRERCLGRTSARSVLCRRRTCASSSCISVPCASLHQRPSTRRLRYLLGMPIVEDQDAAACPRSSPQPNAARVSADTSRG